MAVSANFSFSLQITTTFVVWESIIMGGTLLVFDLGVGSKRCYEERTQLHHGEGKFVC